MKLKDYKKQKAQVLSECEKELSKLTEKEKMELALKLGISFNTVQAYRMGNGKNMERGLQLLEALKVNENT